MRSILPFLLIAVGALAAYSNSLHNPFVFDDVDAIVDNPHLGRLWPPGAAFAAPPGSGASGRPLVALSLALNRAAGGLDPSGYHAVNLLVHVLAAWLLFMLVRGTLRGAGAASGTGAAWIAFAASLVWVVHPLHTAVQDHVVYRNESMAALCLLVVLECVRRVAAAGRGRRGWIAAAVLANVAGMACKETMVAAPLLALLYDRTFLSGSFRRALAARAGLHAGLAAGWAVLAACVAAGDRGTSVTTRYADLGRLDYARTQLGVVAHYLRLAFWPRPLVLDYDWQVAHGVGAVLLPGALVVALLAATLIGLRRRAGYGFLGAVFFLVLAPSSSFVPLAGAVAAEHRMYLPLAAVTVAVVALAHAALRRADALHRAPARALVLAALVAVVIGLVGAARARNRDYTTVTRIWARTAEDAPRNPRAHGNLGAALLVERRYAAAIRSLETALELQPEYPGARANLSQAHRALGLEAAERGLPDSAVAHLVQACRFDPQDGFSLNALAWILATSPDPARRDPGAAVSYAERAVRTRSPAPPEFLDTLAAAHAAVGNYAAALQEAAQARELAARAGKTRLAEAITARIARYASGLPFLEAPGKTP